MAGEHGVSLHFLEDDEARCQKDEPDTKKQAQLAELMNDLGIALNYARDPRLMDTTVLRPDWLANGIYAILRANMLTEVPLVPDGVLTEALLPGIYAAAEKAGMLKRRTMRRSMGFSCGSWGSFRLSFPLDAENRRYLVPGLLAPDEAPDCSQPQDADRVRLRYDFEVVPVPLMGRFIVGLFPLVERGKVWKRGTCLRYAEATARVWMDARERDLWATVGGPEPGE